MHFISETASLRVLTQQVEAAGALVAYCSGEIFVYAGYNIYLKFV